jgi:Rod binding domain-containing protein
MATSMALGSLGAQTGALQASEDRILQGAASRTPTDAAKIDKGAKDFEAVLIGTWLQQAEQSFGTVPGADEDEDVGRGQMMSFGVQSLSTSMAASGGIGIAKMVAKAMHINADKAAAQAQPAADAAPPNKSSEKS